MISTGYSRRIAMMAAIVAGLVTLPGCWLTPAAPPPSQPPQSPPPPPPPPPPPQQQDDEPGTLAIGTSVGLNRYFDTPGPPVRPIMGRFVYGAPSVMIVEQPYFLSLAIAAPLPDETTPQLDARLLQDTHDTLGADADLAFRSGDLRMGAVMTASLTGDGFEVSDLAEARQTIDPHGVTRWLWEVRGKTTGRSSLVMRLAVNKPNGSADEIVRVVPSVIEVRAEADAFLTGAQMAARQGASAATAAQFRAPGSSSAPASLGLRSPGSCKTGNGDSARLALVIGNDAYSGIAPLAHARNDGVRVRDVLAESGFRVTHCEDLDTEQFSNALGAFRDQVKTASASRETAVAFYYAGHGASTPSQNETYLLPVSLRQASVAQIETQGVSVGQIVGGLSKAGARRLVMIVDACRDVLQMEDGEYRGFHALNWRSSAYDIVAYATMWGEKARDNGLYAQSLASAIRAMPGADIADILNRVQTEVSDATAEDQVPQYNDRMPGVFAIRN